jgi:hypothetical protein
MKQSDLYRQNAENCMQMAEAARASRHTTGLRGWTAGAKGPDSCFEVSFPV